MCVTSSQREFTLRLTSMKLSGYGYRHAMDFPASGDGSYYVIGYSTTTVSRKKQAIKYTTTTVFEFN